MPAGFLPSPTHLLQWLCFLKLILAVHRKAYTLYIVRSPGCLKVFCVYGLWAMWLSLSTFCPLTLLSISSGLPNRDLPMLGLLVCLAAVHLLISPCEEHGPEAPIL